MTHVKVCGITSVDDALAAVDSGASAIGLVFASSPRRLDEAGATKIIAAIDRRVPVVGVFQHHTPQRIASMMERCSLDFAQVHASAFGTYADLLGKKLLPAITIRDGQLPDEITGARYGAIVFDSPHADRFTGSATPFDWSLVAALDGTPRVILAGGLTAANVQAALATARPYAVDVSSGVESAPGKKDHDKICHFIEKVREWDYRMNGDISAALEVDSFLKP